MMKMPYVDVDQEIFSIRVCKISNGFLIESSHYSTLFAKTKKDLTDQLKIILEDIAKKEKLI